MRFSIIIPTYNSSKAIFETMNSVLAEISSNDEVIIVDDASTDDTPGLLKSFLDPQIRYIRLSKNSGGPSKPRNIGIQAARGDYLVFFDSDDVMLPGKLSKAYEAIQLFPDVGLFFSNFNVIDEQGKIINEDFMGQYDFVVEKRSISSSEYKRIEFPHGLKKLAHANFIGTSSVVIPLGVLETVGGFDESLNNGDDYDLWMRISREYSLVFIDWVSHSYRVSSRGISKRGAVKMAPARIKVLEKQLVDPVDSEFSNTLKRWIYRNYIDMSLEHLREGQAKSARRTALLALKFKMSYRGLKIVMLSLAGEKCLRGLILVRERLRRN